MGVTPETITVTVPGAPTGGDDAQGNPIVGPPVVTEVEIKAFAPRDSEESEDGSGTRSISGGVVYGYRGTTVPTDAILTIRGEDWQVDGELGDWLSPYGPVPQGIEFSVKRAT